MAKPLSSQIRQRRKIKIKDKQEKTSKFDKKVDRLKFNIMGRNIKSNIGMPILSKIHGISKRKDNLLNEFSYWNKNNVFIDYQKNEIITKGKLRKIYHIPKNFTEDSLNKPIVEESELTHLGYGLNDINAIDLPKFYEISEIDDTENHFIVDDNQNKVQKLRNNVNIKDLILSKISKEQEIKQSLEKTFIESEKDWTMLKDKLLSMTKISDHTDKNIENQANDIFGSNLKSIENETIVDINANRRPKTVKDVADGQTKKVKVKPISADSLIDSFVPETFEDEVDLASDRTSLDEASEEEEITDNQILSYENGSNSLFANKYFDEILINIKNLQNQSISKKQQKFVLEELFGDLFFNNEFLLNDVLKLEDLFRILRPLIKINESIFDSLVIKFLKLSFEDLRSKNGLINKLMLICFVNFFYSNSSNSIINHPILRLTLSLMANLISCFCIEEEFISPDKNISFSLCLLLISILYEFIKFEILYVPEVVLKISQIINFFSEKNVSQKLNDHDWNYFNWLLWLDLLYLNLYKHWPVSYNMFIFHIAILKNFKDNCSIPDLVKDKIDEIILIHSEIKRLNVPCQLLTRKVQSVQLLEPLVDEKFTHFKTFKDYSENDKQYERMRLKKIKRTYKGAVREIRMDSHVLTSKQLQQRLINDAERAEKLKKFEKNLIEETRGCFRTEKKKKK